MIFSDACSTIIAGILEIYLAVMDGNGGVKDDAFVSFGIDM